MLIKLDELVHFADELVMANAVVPSRPVGKASAPVAVNSTSWWQDGFQLILNEARSLVRVSRIEAPEAALLAPEQSFFLRENLKLKLLNARLGLLARQIESSRADLRDAEGMLKKYFRADARNTQSAIALLQEVQSQMRALQLPRVDDTLAVLATAAAGR
jgi:uroporphyrin-3 C-methyltransferase